MSIKLRFLSLDDTMKIKARTRRPQKNGWTDDEKQFLRKHWQSKTSKELAPLLGRTVTSIISMGSDMGLIRKPEAIRKMRTSGKWKTRSDAWTESERQFLRDHWEQYSVREIAEKLNRTVGGVKVMGQRTMRLRKSPEAIAALYKRNKNSGQFRKGQMPPNTVYGDEQVIRIRSNHKRNVSTKYIRVGFRKWKEYQHYIWEQTHGPVPKGMILTFINGDRMDCRLDNLKLITMAENAIRNSGSLNLADGYVANTIAWRDKPLKQELRKHPELIELKREQLKLNRAINHDRTGD